MDVSSIHNALNAIGIHAKWLTNENAIYYIVGGVLAFLFVGGLVRQILKLRRLANTIMAAPALFYGFSEILSKFH